MNKVAIVVVLIVVSAVSFLLGGNLATKGIEKSVDRMQAELGFGHFRVYRELQTDLSSDCRTRVEARLQQMIEEQKMRMAEYVQSGSDAEFESYVNKRDSGLMDELRGYEVNWDKEWVVPSCN